MSIYLFILLGRLRSWYYKIAVSSSKDLVILWRRRHTSVDPLALTILYRVAISKLVLPWLICWVLYGHLLIDTIILGIWTRIVIIVIGESASGWW